MADQQRAVRRVLSVDGGGIRGIIPALVLAHLERQMGAPASELFDCRHINGRHFGSWVVAAGSTGQVAVGRKKDGGTV